VPPPGDDGESLKDTGARVWPYYMTDILPRVLRGEKVLVAAHGNSLRALVMILDRLSTASSPHQAQPRNRRAHGLQAQRRFHRRLQGSARRHVQGALSGIRKSASHTRTWKSVPIMTILSGWSARHCSGEKIRLT
jgi:broad specificity phosphatase PhoE